MNRRYLPVKGHSNLVKDMETGAIINKKAGSNRHQKKALRERNKRTEERLNSLESKVDAIYEMLKGMNK